MRLGKLQEFCLVLKFQDSMILPGIGLGMNGEAIE